MKLSEAVRRGNNRPQANNGLLVRFRRKSPIETCAIGGAYEAVTGQLPKRNMATWHAWLKVAEETSIDVWYAKVKHPLYPHGSSKCALDTVLIQLNDRYGWTREQIADWLETQGY